MGWENGRSAPRAAAAPGSELRLLAAAALLAGIIRSVVPVHGRDCSARHASNSVTASACPVQEGVSGGVRGLLDHTTLVYWCSIECSAVRRGDEGGSDGP